MSRILVIQPELAQASMLKRVLLDRVEAAVDIVESKDAAIAAIDRQTPDVVLFHILMSPEDADLVVAHLRTLSDARHLQMLTMPSLQAPSPARRRKRGLLGRLAPRQVEQGAAPCDPGQFAEEVIDYLTRARAIKEADADERAFTRNTGLVLRTAPVDEEKERDASVEEEPAFTRETVGPVPQDREPGPPPARIEVAEPRTGLEETPRLDGGRLTAEQDRDPAQQGTGEETIHLSPLPDRRRVRRWSRIEVPHVLGVQLATESADLINISSTGVLLRTRVRPPLDVLGDLRPHRAGLSRLVFQVPSGREVSTAHVVRCQVASISDKAILYDVAFRFDQPPRLALPELEPVADASADDEVHHAAVEMPSEVTVPADAREAMSELASVDAALRHIRLMLRRARYAGKTATELGDLAHCLAPRVRELHSLRTMILQRINQDLILPIPAAA